MLVRAALEQDFDDRVKVALEIGDLVVVCKALALDVDEVHVIGNGIRTPVPRGESDIDARGAVADERSNALQVEVLAEIDVGGATTSSVGLPASATSICVAR